MNTFKLRGALKNKTQFLVSRSKIHNKADNKKCSCWQNAGGVFGNKWSKFHRHLANSWTFEVVNLLLSFAVSLIIVTYIARYDGQAIPQLPYGISLNTLLSVCVTISVGCWTNAVSNGMGQLKWVRVKQSPVCLRELCAFDEASRGPWGNLSLIFMRRGGVLGFLGALAGTISVAAAPFSQQAIAIANTFPDGASIAICDGGSAGLTINAPRHNDSTLSQVSPPLQSALHSGITGDFNPEKYSSDFLECQTVNCTWGSFITLGICSNCLDVSATIEYGTDPDSPNFGLPYITNGPSINSSMTDFLIIANVQGTENTVFLNFTSISASDETKATAALECTLSFCVQIVRANVLNGALVEVIEANYIKSEHKNSTSPPVSISNSQTKSWDNTVETFHPPAKNWSAFNKPISIDPLYIEALHNYTVPLFTGIVFRGQYQYPLDVVATLAYNSGADITRKMSNIAASMSRELRVSCDPATRISGIAFRASSMIYIRWRWLMLLLSIQFIGIVFFVALLLTSAESKAQLWKNSILGPLVHGLELISITEHKELNSLHEMEQLADELIVKLETLVRHGESHKLRGCDKI